MRNLIYPRARSWFALVALAGMVSALALAAPPEGKLDFHTSSLFVEGCSCSIPCTCEMGQMRHGCQGVGAVVITSGSFNGTDLAGTRIAYATMPGSWIRLYLQSKSDVQGKALTEFAKRAFADFGKVESVKSAVVEVTGKDGNYSLKVDGGKIMELATEPVLGLDKKTPLSYNNTFNPISPTVMQGKTSKGSYHDGDRSFTLGGSNAYFNANAKGNGKV